MIPEDPSHCTQVRLRILQRHMVVVGSPEGLKRVFQTNQRNYVKDLDFSFHPFLPILGTGLVTAQGDLWQQQRLLMAPTLRVDVLDDVVRCFLGPPADILRAVLSLCHLPHERNRLCLTSLFYMVGHYTWEATSSMEGGLHNCVGV